MILPAIAARLGAVLAPPAAAHRAFVVDGRTVGWLDARRAARIDAFGNVFDVRRDVVRLRDALRGCDSRTAALDAVARTLAGEGALTAWRDERYAVMREWGEPPLFLIERAAARYFGVHTYAVHANGFVERDDGTLALWFARRSPTKAIDPGQLDNLVGGGIAADLLAQPDPIAATLVKEAWEEAGIRDELARSARRASRLEIFREQSDGVQWETIFACDLRLPADFVPANQDGEAVEHRCVTLPEAARLIGEARGLDLVTADASLVVLDFLLRRGAIAPDAPEYEALGAMRTTACWRA